MNRLAETAAVAKRRHAKYRRDVRDASRNTLWGVPLFHARSDYDSGQGHVKARGAAGAPLDAAPNTVSVQAHSLNAGQRESRIEDLAFRLHGNNDWFTRWEWMTRPDQVQADAHLGAGGLTNNDCLPIGGRGAPDHGSGWRTAMSAAAKAASAGVPAAERVRVGVRMLAVRLAAEAAAEREGGAKS